MGLDWSPGSISCFLWDPGDHFLSHSASHLYGGKELGEGGRETHVLSLSIVQGEEHGFWI